MTSLFAAAIAAGWLGMTTAQAQSPPTITQQPSNQAVLFGSNASFSVTAAGTGPFLYQWRFNGSNLPGVINTVAGDGPSSNGISGGFSGDSGKATNASLDAPWGIAVDASNNLYIADWQNSRIRKVGTNGIIATFAGSTTTNFHGDGGAATSAGLDLPRGVAVDKFGNVFICDTGNNRVRKVTNNIISTVAGGGTNTIGDGGSATNATLNGPNAAALDALGNLFIADTGNNRVRKVGTNGVISTFAGGGANAPTNGMAATNASLMAISGIAVDRFGNVYFSCSFAPNDAGVLQVGTNGFISLLGPVGLFGDGFYGYPTGVALDAGGDVLVANINNNVVIKSGSFLPIAGDAQFTGQEWVPFVTAGFSGDGGPATQAMLFMPQGLATDAAGDVFISDQFNNRVRKVAGMGPAFFLTSVTNTNAGNYDVIVSSPYGSVTSSVAVLSIGVAPGLTNPITTVTGSFGGSVTLNATGVETGTGPFSYQWQFNGSNLSVTIDTVAGTGQDGESGDGGPATNAALYAAGVGVDNLGDFFIADSPNERVREVNTSGIISTVAGDGLAYFSGDGGLAVNASLFNPAGVAANGLGSVYIADEANARIRVVSANGDISTLAGNGIEAYGGDGQAATNASLSDPSGVAVDPLGNVDIADRGNNRIRQVGTNGIIQTIAGNGSNGFSGDGGAAVNASLSNPTAVAVDPVGNVYIADNGNKRIRKVSANGIIITVAGSGDGGYYGDGGPATNAFFEAPTSVAVDGFGNIFISDGTEHIRKVGLNGIISTVAGNAGLGFSGDGGPPTNAMLGEVYGLAADIPGDLFIADTGNNRIREINAFGPVLTLNNFNSGEAGNYDLIVTSPFGSVTSAVISVSGMSLTPTLAASLSGTNLVIQFSGAAGATCVLEATGSLAPPANWQPVATNASLIGSGTFTITNVLASPAQFYRLALP